MDNNIQLQYGYSFQWHNIENYKIRDRVFEGNIYTNIDKFIHYVNEEIKNAILDYEDIELDDEQIFTNEQSKFNLDCYPINKDYINKIKDYDYLYYNNNCTWAFIIAKHKLI